MVVRENEDVPEKKVFEKNNTEEVDIKKEDDTLECDICHKIFRTTAVSTNDIMFGMFIFLY